MHKKLHQNIIFAIHHVRRNRLDPANAARAQANVSVIRTDGANNEGVKSTVILKPYNAADGSE